MVTISNNKVHGVILISFCAKGRHLKDKSVVAISGLVCFKTKWQASLMTISVATM